MSGEDVEEADNDWIGAADTRKDEEDVPVEGDAVEVGLFSIRILFPFWRWDRSNISCCCCWCWRGTLEGLPLLFVVKDEDELTPARIDSILDPPEDKDLLFDFKDKEGVTMFNLLPKDWDWDASSWIFDEVADTFNLSLDAPPEEQSCEPETREVTESWTEEPTSKVFATSFFSLVINCWIMLSIIDSVEEDITWEFEWASSLISPSFSRKTWRVSRRRSRHFQSKDVLMTKRDS